MIETFHLGAVVRGGALWEGLDLALDDGEAWIVTGPPSCGKTLLLRILCGDREPDAGEVLVGGQSLYRGAPAANRRFRTMCGTVRDAIPGGAGRTVADLFRLSALAGGGIGREERVRREEELLALVGLAGTGEIPVSCLSVSERTRAVLAAELLRGPKYLFLDMVLSNAGRDWAEPLLALVRALAREGRTIVLAERVVPERLHPALDSGGGCEGHRAAALPGRHAGPFVLSRLDHRRLSPGEDASGPSPVAKAPGEGSGRPGGGEAG